MPGCRQSAWRGLAALLFVVVPSAGFAESAPARETPAAVPAAEPVLPDSPAWRSLAEQFAARLEIAASFEEQRVFPFRREPVVLRGQVRVSRTRGLSLEYTAPESRIMIIDDAGLLVREPDGRAGAPPDPRANAANGVIRQILHFDLAALARDFDLSGRRDEATWTLTMIPRSSAFRRSIGDIHVVGEGDFVRRIELRRSARQHITITMAAPRRLAAFPADELVRYFRN